MQTETQDLPKQRPPVKAVVAALIGNVMEYFDFVIYGLVAVVIGDLFFPSENHAVSLLASLATFGVAFLFRPLGAAFFGSLGDRKGRKIALSLSIIVMGLSTATIGLLPTHATVGILAPVLLVIVRSIQGFSVGGEFAGAATFIVENAPGKKRGFWSSFLLASSSVGTVGASALILILRATLSEQAFMSFGWRIPFLLAFPLAMIGLYLRRHTDETAAFQAMVEDDTRAKSPLIDLFRNNFKTILLAIALASMTGITFYYFNTYFINYLVSTIDLEPTMATFLAMASQMVYIPFCLVAGLAVDRIGRRTMILGGTAGVALLAIPVFLMLSSHSLWLAFFGLVVFAALTSALGVAVTVTQTELFPPEVRMSGVALGNNIGTALIGGTSPFVAAALVASTGSVMSPSFYLVAIAIIVLIIVSIMLPETLKSRMSPKKPQKVGVKG